MKNYRRTVSFAAALLALTQFAAANVLEELIYPDEVHDFLLHKNWVRAYRASVEFFDRHLK